MVRNIIGVIVGYISMFILVFILFTILYLLLGVEGSFEAGSFRVSAAWILISILLNFIAAVAGGYICMAIAKNKTAAYFLAGIVLILGLIMAIPYLGGYAETANIVRESGLSNMEAMQQAKQPDFILLLTPVIGAIGVIAGLRLKKGKQIPKIKEQTV